MELALAAPLAQPLTAMRREPDANGIVETAYAASAPTLIRRVAAMTHDSAIAEDLVQEAFVRLAVEVRAGRVPDNIGAWLHRVVANLVASRGRHAAVVDRKLGDLPRPDHEPSPELASIDAEEAIAVRRALASLGSADRQALVMAAQGYRGPEIARRLGRTQGATRTLLCRARSRLRGELEAAGISR
jgi:RNA polymerase sigma-70 factor (ECF subfamily)